MPRKIKNHLLNYLRGFCLYAALIGTLKIGHILTSLVSSSDPFEMLQAAVTVIYAAYITWFCWRFYTGVIRDGDLWIDGDDSEFF